MRHRFVSLAVLVCVLSFGTAIAQSVDNPRVITVSPDGTGADYSSLAGALGGVSSPSSSNRYVILVYPGIYTGQYNTNLTWPGYVSLRGVDRTSTIIKGSVNLGYYDDLPLINFTGAQEVEVSNITLDGSAQIAAFTGQNFNGAIWVGAGSIRFNNVTLKNGWSNFAPGFTLSSYGSGGGGQITVENSQTGPIVDGGDDWTIRNTAIVATANAESQYVYAYARYYSGGKATIIGSTITAEATTGSGDVSAIYVDGTLTGSSLTISSSHLIGRNLLSSPSGVTAALYEQGGETSGSSVYIEGSILEYQSVSGAGGGKFHGIYVPEGTNTPVSVRTSSIRGIGSGGTRSDVYNDSENQIALTAVEHSTLTGDTATYSPDQRQGQFSSDLVVPLTSPTLGPVNGQIWIDTVNNKLCYRSGGSTRCVTGS